jgi:hypothetical protein
MSSTCGAFAVGLAVHAHGLDAHRPSGAGDAAGDLAAVGDHQPA